MHGFSPYYFWSSITAKKKSKLTGRLSNFTNLFIFTCDDYVSDADDLFWFYQDAPCCCGKIFCKITWQIQVPYIDIICVHSMFHLHPPNYYRITTTIQWLAAKFNCLFKDRIQKIKINRTLFNVTGGPLVLAVLFSW